MKHILLSASFFLLTASGFAADSENHFKILNQDIAKVVTSPARFDSGDWITVGAVAVGFGALYAADGEIRDMFQRNRGNTTNSIENVFKSFGRIETAVPAFALIYGGAKIFDNKKLARASAMSLESFIIAGLIFEAVKFATHRDRPYENTSPYVWHGPGLYDRNQSFPSGDAATAFALLTPIAHVYGDTPLVAPLAYTCAALAGLGRMNHNDHWASDVFIGSALGYFTAKAVIKYREADSPVTLLPILGADTKGLVVVSRF
ncbi:MAG: phosphatase PAP2 family protein [Elusimicrobiaceae bacterium]